MIKTFTVTLAALCVSLLLTSVIITTPGENLKINKEKDGGGDPDDNYNEYYQWDLKRLADPATGLIPAGIRRAELAFAAQMPVPKTMYRGTGYVNRGPYNVGGRTRCFAIDANDSNIYIAASVSGAIFRSTNAGVTWSKTLESVYDQGFTCLSQDTRPGHTNVWYAGSGEGYGQSASAGGAYFLGNGIYKSTDDGVTWDTLSGTNANEPQAFVKAFQIIWSIKTDPSRMDSDIVYASAYGGLYRSNNGGSSWKLIKGSFGGSDAYYTNVDVSPTGKVYATLSSDGGVNGGIWRSSDGLHYTKILPDSFPTGYNLIVSGISPSNENEIYFLANTLNLGAPDTNYLGTVQWNELWRYTYINDTTSTWENFSANLPEPSIHPFDKFDAQGSYNLVVAVKPDDPNTVIIGGTNVFRSTDGFSTGNNITKIGGYKLYTNLPNVESYTNHHSDLHVFFFDKKNPSVFYNSSDGGVFKTLNVMAPDSVAWISLNNGYVTTQFYTIAIDNAAPGDSTIVAAAQDNGTWFVNSMNAQHPWVHPYGGDGADCYIASNKSAYYLSEQSGRTERALLDAHGNVTSFTRIDPQDGRNFQFVNPFAVDPTGENVMYMGANHKLWRNSNLAGIPMIGGYDSITTNWTFYPDTLTVAQGNITAIACSENPAHVVYFGTDKKNVFKINHADTANSAPVNITWPSFPTGGVVNCIAVDPLNSNNVIVVFSNYLIYSIWNTTNGGTTWEKTAGNLEQYSTGGGNGPSCRWASIMHVSNGTLYFMATSTGLYATDTLNGVNTVWVQQGADAIGNDVCDMVLTRAADGFVAVATHGNGVFTTNITNVGQAVGIKELTPIAIGGQWTIFPNPGAGDAQLMANLNSSGNYIITVYDLSGKLITSFSKQLFAGQQTIPLNIPGAAASGIYLVNLTNGTDSRTLRYLKM